MIFNQRGKTKFYETLNDILDEDTDRFVDWLVLFIVLLSPGCGTFSPRFVSPLRCIRLNQKTAPKHRPPLKRKVWYFSHPICSPSDPRGSRSDRKRSRGMPCLSLLLIRFLFTDKSARTRDMHISGVSTKFSSPLWFPVV